MNAWLTICALCLLAILKCETISGEKAKDAAIVALGQEKLEHMLAESKAGNGVIKIKGSDFEKYITKGPRPYLTYVVLTALQSGNCKPCEQIEEEIKSLGRTLEDHRSKLASDSDSPIVFVVEADYLDNRQTFQKLSLQTAPSIVLVPTAKTKKEVALGKLFKYIGPKNTYSLTSGRKADDMLRWIGDRAKMEFEVAGSFEIPEWAIPYGVPALIGAVGAWYKGWLDIVRRSMLIYAVLSIAAYGFFIGGGWFSIIRETPWVHHDKGQIGYISHQSRYQYTLEGYLIGVANTVAGVAAWLYINAQRDGWQRDRFGKVVSRWWSKAIPVFVPFGLLVVGWYAIMWAYTRKNGHYNFGRVGLKG